MPCRFAVTGSEDCTVRVWDLDTGSLRVADCHQAPVHSILSTSDGLRSVSLGAHLRTALHGFNIFLKATNMCPPDYAPEHVPACVEHFLCRCTAHIHRLDAPIRELLLQQTSWATALQAWTMSPYAHKAPDHFQAMEKAIECQGILQLPSALARPQHSA